ncbi:MAG: bifunctional (p)ppGpp synthetase/guanosine-3',5'-bis(diphosphate) 3'-pyrophosphohydrolase [Neomegalonema sp.]|nr:bifunctional (p)ppGpp synthetase/guanosine-3',5'-bis(diphosphate) 3'-pyrophosphohydrolase [Neomegalonema sp.]
MIRQFELIDMVRAYNPNTDEALINKAYVFGIRAHGSQTRASGEPYFNHPVEVAAILTDLKLDDATIVTALLHDTIEDTAASYQQLAQEFGSTVADLVDGVTKLSKLKLVSKESQQAENLRKLLVAMSKDPRVLLVKMADRLHNMRTIGHLRDDKQRRIAEETLEIFAPLAGRMGMQSMREELEDLAFQVINSEARHSIMRRFVHLRNSTEEDFVAETVAAIEIALKSAGVSATVSGREKRPYSIWRKANIRKISFEKLSDIVGFRLIVANEAECYRTLGVIHRRWHAVPGRFKDYISGPKSNGYRSLHTTVISKTGQRIEIQIRTPQMNEVAETGVAAHWAYRDGVRSENPFAVDPFSWLREFIRKAELGTPAGEGGEEFSHADFLAETKLDIGFEQVFCFTPDGEVINLPQGATMLDFAYAVHTDLGNSAVAAVADGRQVPLQNEVRNGQTVKIVQSKGGLPASFWIDIVKTGRARAAIRKTLRNFERKNAATLGKRLIEGVFEQAQMPFSTRALETAAEKLGAASSEAILADVGEAKLSAHDIFKAVYPEVEHGPGAKHAGESGENLPMIVRGNALSAMEGAPLIVPAAKCCSPIPGDRVIALREPGRGYFLHTIDCDALALFDDDMERWVDVDWSPEAHDKPINTVPVELVLANEPGALGTVCSLVGASGANIADMIFQDRKPDFYRLEIVLEVRDLRHLTNIVTTLSAQPAVASIDRRRHSPEFHGVRAPAIVTAANDPLTIGKKAENHVD